MKKSLRIYGDNIVECTRFILILADSVQGKVQIEKLPKVTTEFLVKNDTLEMDIKIFPGFGRWSNDIFSILEKNGSPLKEAPDILVTEVINKEENLIFSVEFCSALPAGNQAWQRHGRGYSILKAGVPYIFITHLGGSELTKDRVNKSIRSPNLLIPFSYLNFSRENDFKFIPIYLPNPGYKRTDLSFRSELFSSNEDVLKLFNHLITKKDFPLEIARRIVSKCYHITNDKIKDAENLIYEKFDSHKTTHFTENNGVKKWKKIITIPHTATVRKLNIACSTYSTELISNKLPFCIILPKDIKKFVDEMDKIYKVKNIGVSLVPTLPLVVSFVAGFKPKGDDSRPDRGLSPLIRMLFGEKVNLISIVYGPINLRMIQKLETDPDKVIKTNGLLSSVFYTSDAVILDSLTSKTAKIFATKRIKNANLQNKIAE